MKKKKGRKKKRCKNSSRGGEISYRVPWTVTTQASRFFLQACEIFIAFFKREKNLLKLSASSGESYSLTQSSTPLPRGGSAALDLLAASSADSTCHNPLTVGLCPTAGWGLPSSAGYSQEPPTPCASSGEVCTGLTPVSPPGVQRELQPGELQEGFDTLVHGGSSLLPPEASLLLFNMNYTLLQTQLVHTIHVLIPKAAVCGWTAGPSSPWYPALIAASSCLMHTRRISCLPFGCVRRWTSMLEVCQPSAPIPGAAHAGAGLLALLLSTKAVVGEELRGWFGAGLHFQALLSSPPQGVPRVF